MYSSAAQRLSGSAADSVFMPMQQRPTSMQSLFQKVPTTAIKTETVSNAFDHRLNSDDYTKYTGSSQTTLSGIPMPYTRNREVIFFCRMTEH
jgi:hypothetical protein